MLKRLGDEGRYNGVPLKIIIDKDIEVEIEGGVFTRTTLATLSSAAILEPQRGDEIQLNGEAFSVQSVQSDDGSVKVLQVRKL